MAETGTEATNKSLIGRYGPLLALIGVGITIYASGLYRYISLTAVIENRDWLENYVGHNWLLSIVIYMMIYTLVVAISFPGASFLTILGGFLFGWLAGGLATVIAATIGAMVVFLVAKSSFGDVLARKADGFAQKLAAGFCEDAWNYMLFLRLVPVFPFWLVNITPALFGVRLKTFIITTFIGIIPGTLAFSFLGGGFGSIIDALEVEFMACKQGENPAACQLNFHPGHLLSPQLLMAFALLGVVALLPSLFKRWQNRNHTAAN